MKTSKTSKNLEQFRHISVTKDVNGDIVTISNRYGTFLSAKNLKTLKEELKKGI